MVRGREVIDGREWRRSSVSPVMLLLGAVVLAGLLVGILAMVLRPATPGLPLPTPNAYDTLQHAGRMVRELPDDYAETMDQKKLASFLGKNASVLELVDQAIGQQSAVPLERQADMEAVLDEIGPTRQALRLVHAAARVAELEGDSSRAAKQYAKMFVLANEWANGGLLVHALAALAYEDLALQQLNGIVAELSSEEKREVLKLLDSAGRPPTDFDQIFARDRARAQRELGSVRTWILWITTRDSERLTDQRFVQRDAEVVELYGEVMQKLRP